MSLEMSKVAWDFTWGDSAVDRSKSRVTWALHGRRGRPF